MQLDYTVLLFGVLIGSFMGFAFAQALEEFRHWRVMCHFRDMAVEVEKRNKKIRKRK